jgi:phosphonate transport system substrate-binding protein
VAFVCTLAYVKGNESFGMELLVVPQMHGEIVYYSYLIIPEESSATRLEDLRDASFAFTDPMSNSGHLAPTYQLSLLGEAPASFFGRYVFTYSHDNSITAVADKLLDGAAVDSLVYDQMVANNPELASKTQVIARWGPYGIPPVVISSTLDPQLKKQLLDFFLDLHNSDEGGRILHHLAIDKFVVAPDDIYDSVREMKTELGW